MDNSQPPQPANRSPQQDTVPQRSETPNHKHVVGKIGSGALMLPTSDQPSPSGQNYIHVTELFTQLDDFSRAIEAARQAKNFEAVIQGVDLIYQNFLLILKNQGIEPFSDRDEVFDPERHEIIEDERDSPEKLPVISEVLRCGYKRGSYIFRKASVKVR